MIVHGLPGGLLMLELPDQLALCLTKRASEVRVLGNRYQRR
jgi:hypothetical protein